MFKNIGTLLLMSAEPCPITYFDASKFKTQFACELKNFNVEDFIDRKEARKWTDTLSMPWFLV
jgi:hypothetical protein